MTTPSDQTDALQAALRELRWFHNRGHAEAEFEDCEVCGIIRGGFATPAPSVEADAAWEALNRDTTWTWTDLIARHRPIIEAAIRGAADTTALDVEVLILVDLPGLIARYGPSSPSLPHAIAAEYDRLRREGEGRPRPLPPPNPSIMGPKG